MEIVVIAYKTYCGNEHSASLHLQCFFVKSWKLLQRTRLMKCSDTWLKTTSTKWLSWTWDKINVLPHKILPDQCVWIFSEKFAQSFVEEKSNFIYRNIKLLAAGTSPKLIPHLSTVLKHSKWLIDCPWTCFKIGHIWLEYPVMLCFRITTPSGVPHLPHSFVQMLLQIQNSFPNREAIVQRPLQT